MTVKDDVSTIVQYHNITDRYRLCVTTARKLQTTSIAQVRMRFSKMGQSMQQWAALEAASKLYLTALLMASASQSASAEACIAALTDHGSA